MARISDLLAVNQPSGEVAPVDIVAWYARVVAPVPVLLTDPLFVVIPDIDPERVWGPCRWNISLVPTLNMECIVMFDNRQDPWVPVLW